MPKFRKKPIEIEAMQVAAANRNEIIAWAGRAAYIGRRVTDFEDGSSLIDTDPVLVIRTLEGDMAAKEGDWIIRGVKGEFYPCKPDIFEATYEPVSGNIELEKGQG
jgi:hypothetical protein